MSAIHRFTGTDTDFNWEEVTTKEFTNGTSQGASGKIIISEKDDAEYFVFRYIRIEPGGYSTFKDVHTHDHGVYILHGRGIVMIEDVNYEIGPRDMIYISPLEHHHLKTVGDEPLGFLCVIPNKKMLKKLSTPA